MSRVSNLGSILPGGLVIGLCLLPAARVDAAPAFRDDDLRSQDGAALLEWAGEGDAFEVQRADDGAFSHPRVLYVGTMASAHVSGLRDGVHHFRVRTVGDDAWSSPATVTVEHHSMALVWPLFAVGAAVFLATAGFVASRARDLEPGRSA